MRRYATYLCLAVGILLLGVPAITQAQNSSGIGGKPANPREDNPRTSSIFVHEIKPGESVRDAVRLINNSGETREVDIYPTDAQIASGGAFSCEQKVDTDDQAGAWITLDKNSVVLDNNKTEDVGFTISVPKNAPVGEHNACIAIQPKVPAVKSNTNGVSLSFRSAIRVAITVPGEFKKNLVFEGLQLLPKNNDMFIVNQKLRNLGNVSLDTDLQTTLRSIFGFKIQQNGGEYPILPGQNAEFNFEFKKPFWGGLYVIDASANYNDDPTTSLGEKSDTSRTIRKKKLTFFFPKPLAILLYALIVLIIVAPILKKRRDRKQLDLLKSQAIEHTAKKNDSIMAIAKQYDCDWKQIAKLNKLQEPYHLDPKQIILVVPGKNYVPKQEKPKKEPKPSKDKPKKNTKPTANKTDQKSKTKRTTKKTSTSKKQTKKD